MANVPLNRRFVVHLRTTAFLTQAVEVDAVNEADAIEKALDRADESQWEYDHMTGDGAQVEDVEEEQ